MICAGKLAGMFGMDFDAIGLAGYALNYIIPWSEFMFGMKKKSIADLGDTLPRTELVNRSRVLVIDDEAPGLLADLKEYGFAVDHASDFSAQLSNSIEQCQYDLILLDFGEVGTKFGDEEGLSLLKHIKAVIATRLLELGGQAN